MVYDVNIVGGGPAGLTAGVYARTRKLSTLILEAQATGGQLEWLYPTKSVYDYPSYIAIEGGELAELFVLHSRESGAEIRAEEVVDVQRQASGFKLTTREGTSTKGGRSSSRWGWGCSSRSASGCPERRSSSRTAWSTACGTVGSSKANGWSLSAAETAPSKSRSRSSRPRRRSSSCIAAKSSGRWRRTSRR